MKPAEVLAADLARFDRRTKLASRVLLGVAAVVALLLLAGVGR